MGLSGISSPLPSYYSDLVTEESETNNCLNDFLNIFNHRIYYLFYNAWKKYQLFSFLNFSGFEYFPSCNSGYSGNASKNNEEGLSLVPYCGILLTKCRSKYALEIILTHYFKEKTIHIEEYIPRTKKLKKLLSLGKAFQLGRNTILGEEYKDSCGMFRIVIGPLKLIDFVKFTSDSENIKLLKNIVKLFITDQLEYDIEVQLRMDGLIPVILGSDSTKLGETSLLGKSTGQNMVYSIIVK
jgi:type VI secretion system protein ImpH